MDGKDLTRFGRVERAWEGTRLEAQALAQAYEQIEPGTTSSSAHGSARGTFRKGFRQRPKAALLFAQGGEPCPKS